MPPSNQQIMMGQKSVFYCTNAQMDMRIQDCHWHNATRKRVSASVPQERIAISGMIIYNEIVLCLNRFVSYPAFSVSPVVGCT